LNLIFADALLLPVDISPEGPLVDLEKSLVVNSLLPFLENILMAPLSVLTVFLSKPLFVK